MRDPDQITSFQIQLFSGSVCNTYDVEIKPGQNDIVTLTIAMCVDQMSYDVG